MAEEKKTEEKSSPAVSKKPETPISSPAPTPASTEPQPTQPESTPSALPQASSTTTLQASTPAAPAAHDTPPNVWEKADSSHAEAGSHPFQDMPIVDDEGGSKKKMFIWLLIVIVFLGVVGAGGYFGYQFLSKKASAPKKETVPIQKEEEPTPTPAAELDREDLSIQVLNGTGKSGAAGAAQTVLEDKGYQNIETGNADNYDYEQTVIKLKDAKMSFFEMLSKDLKDDYDVSSDPKTLDEESEYDAVVIVGKPVE